MKREEGPQLQNLLLNKKNVLKQQIRKQLVNDRKSYFLILRVVAHNMYVTHIQHTQSVSEHNAYKLQSDIFRTFYHIYSDM
jgi:hypothetical protein